MSMGGKRESAFPLPIHGGHSHKQCVQAGGGQESIMLLEIPIIKRVLSCSAVKKKQSLYMYVKVSVLFM